MSVLEVVGRDSELAEVDGFLEASAEDFAALVLQARQA